ncbi:hypothetical protein GBZ26_11245 [Azospirillum formosense]|uniref:DUF4136 domain-containing protein n=1 Tax=Azospirillum formosense TaxID=861533 RepID=A0ABX2L119_9PROT|nr:hypothetical protein [Azospirillum formosense]MBY3756706.1 hypothetical protein [Azospirillum formosense]NUB19786.1 hypothetical protein [Azospirillum formosense]
MTMKKMAVVAILALAGCAQPYQTYQPYTPSPSTYTPPKAKASAPTPPGGWKAAKVKMTKDMQKAIEDGVRNSLKDPLSAQIVHTVAYKEADGGIIACGTVNAKNSYGGYTGSTPFRAFVAGAKGKYYGVGAMLAEDSLSIFYEINPMCDPKEIL